MASVQQTFGDARITTLNVESGMPPAPKHPLPSDAIVALKDINVFYGAAHAVAGVTFDVPKNKITALIGPSGCGKSTVIRCVNRMNDLIPGARVEGVVNYHGTDINDKSVDPVEVRRNIGMVFQRPNPFPKSIYDNITWAVKIHGIKTNLDALVERCLRQAALWDEVKDKLKESGSGAVRRSATASLHCAHAGDQPGRDFDGRTGQRARPDLDPENRGLDARSGQAVHDCDRHAQHAAGGARFRSDRLFFLERKAPGDAGGSPARPASSSPIPAISAPRITSPAASASKVGTKP